MADKIIIVKKKKSGGHGHHGGSWKVAYADFVTAMMAFFMVMWIMGMDQGVKDMVQGYFSNPIGFKRSFSGGMNIISQGNSPAAIELQNMIMIRRFEEEARFREAGERIERQLAELGMLENADAEVEVVVTDEGLRIEMMETGGEATFFAGGSSALQPALHRVLTAVAVQIAELPNGVVIEGHTDAIPFGQRDYSNWELSVDRANAARRVLVAAGMPEDHLVEVRGYADRHPKIPEDPNDPRNRRISLLLPYDTPTPSAAATAAGATPTAASTSVTGGEP